MAQTDTQFHLANSYINDNLTESMNEPNGDLFNSGYRNEEKAVDSTKENFEFLRKQSKKRESEQTNQSNIQLLKLLGQNYLLFAIPKFDNGKQVPLDYLNHNLDFDNLQNVNEKNEASIFGAKVKKKTRISPIGSLIFLSRTPKNFQPSPPSRFHENPLYSNNNTGFTSVNTNGRVAKSKPTGGQHKAHDFNDNMEVPCECQEWRKSENFGTENLENFDGKNNFRTLEVCNFECNKNYGDTEIPYLRNLLQPIKETANRVKGFSKTNETKMSNYVECSECFPSQDSIGTDWPSLYDPGQRCEDCGASLAPSEILQNRRITDDDNNFDFPKPRDVTLENHYIPQQPQNIILSTNGDGSTIKKQDYDNPPIFFMELYGQNDPKLGTNEEQSKNKETKSAEMIWPGIEKYQNERRNVPETVDNNPDILPVQGLVNNCAGCFATRRAAEKANKQKERINKPVKQEDSAPESKQTSKTTVIFKLQSKEEMTMIQAQNYDIGTETGNLKKECSMCLAQVTTDVEQSMLKSFEDHIAVNLQTCDMKNESEIEVNLTCDSNFQQFCKDEATNCVLNKTETEELCACGCGYFTEGALKCSCGCQDSSDSQCDQEKEIHTKKLVTCSCQQGFEACSPLSVKNVTELKKADKGTQYEPGIVARILRKVKNLVTGEEKRNMNICQICKLNIDVTNGITNQSAIKMKKNQSLYNINTLKQRNETIYSRTNLTGVKEIYSETLRMEMMNVNKVGGELGNFPTGGGLSFQRRKLLKNSNLDEHVVKLQESIKMYKVENENLRKLIEECQCLNMQSKNMEQDPPIRPTSSGLLAAIEILQSKCNSKDGVIKAFAGVLRGSKHLEQIAKNLLAPCLQYTYWDFDQYSLYLYFRRFLLSLSSQNGNASENISRDHYTRRYEPKCQIGIPAPRNFQIIHDICKCLLVSWEKPENTSDVTGYEVSMNGSIVARVRSPLRTETIFGYLSTSATLEISLRAVGKNNLCSLPVTITYRNTLWDEK